MKITRSILTVNVLMGLMLISTQVFAALELELTQGVDAAQPIAILKFDEQGQLPAAIQQQDKLTDIIQTDLSNSGRFRLPDDALIARLGNSRQIDAWGQQGFDELVTGTILYQGNTVQVTVQMRQTHGNQPFLLNKSFRITPNQWRAVAHHISDEIYRLLTGDRGYFATRITYVLHSVERRNHQFTLEVADADGHNSKPLLISRQPIMSPTWSPDGRQIAYVSFEGQRAAIYRVIVASGERRLVSKYPGINGAPAWSPDGRKIAMVLSKSGAPKIYIQSLVDNSLTQITDGLAIDTEPSWSPDGNTILFTSNRGGTPQIYRIDLRSKAISRVSFVGNYNARARYTADGNFIVMQHREGSMFTIALQELNTGYIQEITHAGFDESPSVAPSGKMVIYATRFGGNRVLSLVSIDGRVQVRLPANRGNVQEPAWSPFLA